MPKRHEAALRVKPLYQKGAQSLSDTEALEVKGIYEQWHDLCDRGETASKGYKFLYGKQLCKTEQPEYTFTALHVPGATGTESLFSFLDETNAGTIDNPIPYNGNMALEAGKYYSEDGVVYYCTQDTINPVYAALADLVPLYVEVVNG